MRYGRLLAVLLILWLGVSVLWIGFSHTTPGGASIPEWNLIWLIFKGGIA